MRTNVQGRSAFSIRQNETKITGIGWQRHLLEYEQFTRPTFVPEDKTVIKHLSIMPQKVQVKTDPYILNARIYQKSPESGMRAAILFIPGWDPGNFDEMAFDAVAEYCADRRKCVAMVMTYRGQGSEGNSQELTRADFLEDILASYDYLAGLPGVDQKNIFAVGESFGGHMASILTTKRPVAKLVLRAPSDFPSDGFADEPHIHKAGGATRAWKSLPHKPQDSFALAAVSRFPGDILIVASQNDETIPIQTTLNYREAAGVTPRTTFASIDAGHVLLRRREIEAFRDILYKWLFNDRSNSWNS
jgi:uncharacterized protein